MNKWNALTLLTLFASLLSLYFAWQVRKGLTLLISLLQDLLTSFREAYKLKTSLDEMNEKLAAMEKGKPPIITPGPGRIQ